MSVPEDCTGTAVIEFSDFDAAFFDLDGTLVETMPLHYAAYAEALGVYGLSLSSEQFMALVGPPAYEAIPRFIAAAGGDPDRLPPVAEVHAAKKRAFARALTQGTLTRLPAYRLLEAAALHIPVALVSSGNREGVTAIVEALGCRSLFQVIVTGDDVSVGKPDPGPYLLAATTLGVTPSKCVAFEDTDDGLSSAEKAGMRVFDVRSMRALE